MTDCRRIIRESRSPIVRFGCQRLSAPPCDSRPANSPPLTAPIVEWNGPKGYGFLQVKKERVFLHISDFAERHKKPEVGDRIQFVLGQDSKGRTCARRAVHVNDGGRLTVLSMFMLVCLLALPAGALHRHAEDLRWAAAYAFVISALAYGAYALDKRRARAGEWRWPETRLHFLELLGGWPGAFVAQRRLRHKSSKGSYQAVFWLIVLVYQFAAFDSFQEWRLSRYLSQALDPIRAELGRQAQ